jgi:TolB-like protein/DNA-binding SARP family transcriptional activator/tetratricopeptide (TPR) repeat protein
MYRLRTFGGLILERDGVPTDEIVPQRKALVLLAILAVHETMGRERLMALLWPESDTERARGSLKQAIHTLRRQLSEPELLLGTAELRLNPERIECDVQLFLRALDRGDAEEAVSLHRGPFLEGVHLDGTPDFERWVDGWRDEFAARQRGALESLAVDAEARGDTAAAVDWWRRLQGADPFSSRAALKLMEALDRAGDPAAALRHAHVHATLLREELSVAPDAAVGELAERIRAGAGRSRGAAPSAPSPGVPDERAAGAGEPGGVVPAVPVEGPGGVEGPEQPVPAHGSGGSNGPVAPAPTAPPAPMAGPTPARRRPALVASLVLLLAAVAAGTIISSTRSARPAGTLDVSTPPSVAVLPLVNMSADGDLDYLADGIAEEILNTLASIPGIRVSARTSSFYFRGQSRPIGEIAERLGVDHVLEGSLRTDGDQIRVTAQLIDARSDRHLWSRTFDSDFTDIFAVQEEIARTVAAALRVQLVLPEITGPRSVAADPAAHDLYLRGLFHWNRRSTPDLLLAIRFFEEATELDPGYARPWAGLALVYAVVPIGFAPPLGTDVARARLEAAADRALALDSTLAEVHAARGLSYHFEWRWDDAEREYLKAIELNPRYATAHQWYAEHLAKVGRGPEAVASMRRALELDPLSLVIQNDLGLVLLLDRQYEAAREAWEAALRMDPSFVIPHYFLHRLALGEGRLADAEESGRRWVALSGAATVEEVATLTRAVGDAGLRDEAMAILDAWASGPAPRWHDIAFYRTYLGALDAAIDALEAGVREEAPMMAQIGHSPWVDPLRANPRFTALARRLAFPE